jgi:hypothetical protein
MSISWSMKRFLTIVLLPIAVVVLLAAITATATTQFVRWDIINLTVVKGVPTISSGGIATAIGSEFPQLTPYFVCYVRARPVPRHNSVHL